MRPLAVLLLAIAATLSVAAETSEGFTPSPWLGNEQIPARRNAAKVTTESADVLESKGYVRIGNITVVDKTTGKNSTPADTTLALLRKAAASGGDLVLLEWDNVSDTRLDVISFGYSARVGEKRTAAGTYTEYGRFRGRQEKWQMSSASSGTVWRLDPDLARRVAPNLERIRRVAVLSPQEVPDKPLEQNGKWGYVNATGEFVIKPIFDWAFPFYGNSALACVRYEEKWGYIDQTGAFVILPTYDDAASFNDELAAVRIRNRWGFIDQKGRLVIPFERNQNWSMAPFKTPMFMWGVGLAIVNQVGADEDGAEGDNHYGCIDKTGRLVIPTVFDEIGTFVEGLAPAVKDRLKGVLSRDGKWVAQGDAKEEAAPPAITLLREMAAEKGDAETQFRLGADFAKGKGGFEKNAKEAAKWYHKAADRKHPGAAFALAEAYSAGDGVAKDEAETLKWYRCAAELGHAGAQSEMGWKCYSGEGLPMNKTEAAKWYRKAAEQGVALAQYNLGVMLSSDSDVAQDPAEAVKWYRLAADQGHVKARNNLGLAYANGTGVAKDAVEAVKWYRLAADQGHASAQINLGLVYASGTGVAKDAAEAVKWFRLAADQGQSLAMVNLAAAYASGTGVAKDTAEAANWCRQAALKGNGGAQNYFGAACAMGEGVKKDEIEALAWFLACAASGNQLTSENRILKETLEKRFGEHDKQRAQIRSEEIVNAIKAAGGA